MSFKIAWDNDEKTVMRYSAHGQWNWRDYHGAIRQSLYTLHRHPHLVDVIIDIRGGDRAALPSGLAAHGRTFGKKLSPQMSGRAIAIGFPPEAVAVLGVGEDRTMTTPDGFVVFVDTDEEAQTIIKQWRA